MRKISAYYKNYPDVFAAFAMTAAASSLSWHRKVLVNRLFCLIVLFLFLSSIANAKAPLFPEQKKIRKMDSPQPDSTNHSLTLSLNEAILVAVRDNPNVQQSQLSYVSQKFNLWVQQWQFYPHYAFQASATGGETNSFNIQPSVSLLTPVGTQVSLASANTETNHYSPNLSFKVMQPLMRGFGKAIVESALNNAKDTEVISRLTVEGTLRSTITAVINAYLDVVTAERTIAIDEAAVKRAEKSVEQTKLFIKAGHKAGNELVTVQADVASSKSQLENDKNNLVQARYALLTAIGMDPNTPVRFTTLNPENLIKKYHLPLLDQAKQLTLHNDIQYQIDQITLHGPTTRSLMVAEDNTRWQLNLTANAATRNAGSNNVELALQIPIDDQLSKQAVVNAKIALKQAELALMQEKWSKETSAINGWNNVVSAERALRFAEDAEVLQEKTYNISYQKYAHGLIDSLELQTAQVQLIQSQQTLLNAQIGYLKALVNLDLLIGNTLNTWDIKVRL
ncbi:TolC family protein [Aquicella lusitana]|uniref:Outer membrane protein TolC n=1 Tax=Aquicella lusitana TaxID=254246 RepID=A0A370GXI2_9COXI|nr:TolC family protein [Aquicella lusitana]RDI46593.1 outer membrane protein TolC [Aquicella lusitana]VVC74257.1 hypothetical protein AQULUS_20220 [Aquicella lusitana]